MSTFLIFGATGAVGRFLLPQLLAGGACVHAVSRGAAAAQAAAQPIWIRGDLSGTIEGLIAPAEIVLSLGPLDAFALWFERQPLAGVRRVVALSSMSAQTKRDSRDAAERELSARLRDAEARLLRVSAERAIACTLFRPTLIYGGGDDRSLAPIARFARRWRVLPIPLGARGLRQPVHAADLAAAVLAVLECAAAHGNTYELGGGERLRFDHLLMRLRQAIPQIVVPLPVPGVLINAALRVLARADTVRVGTAALRRLREPLIADNTDASRDFGYAPRNFIARDVMFVTDR